MRTKIALLVGLIWIVPALANCNLYQFRWSCNLPINDKPRGDMDYTVYCRNLPVYVNRESYLQVVRYQQANINMDLIVDHEFIAGPCKAGSQARMIEDDYDRITPNGQPYGPNGYLYK